MNKRGIGLLGRKNVFEESDEEIMIEAEWPSKRVKEQLDKTDDGKKNEDETQEEGDYMSMVIQDYEPADDIDQISREELIAEAQGRTGEDKSRHKALKTSLIEKDPENKGLKIMKMMGFKVGSTLGTGDSVVDREKSESPLPISLSSEPVMVERKIGRGGVGYDTAIQHEIRKSVDEGFEKQKLSKEEFKSRISKSYSQKKLDNQIIAAQKLAIDLDARKKNIDSGEIYDTENPLSLNIVYRSLVCEQQLAKKMREMRRNMENPDFDFSIAVEPTKEDPIAEQELEEFKRLAKSDQLFRIINYLRNVYYYCMWCGFSYDNEQDMEENCPGLLEMDH